MLWLHNLLLLFSAVQLEATGTSHILNLLRNHGVLIDKQLEVLAADVTLQPGTSTIKQWVNHFLDDDTRQWDQRYFYNLGFYKDTNINFLYVGGESAESLDSVRNTIAMQYKYAQQFQARLFTLEHRFFGASQPTGNLSTDSYVYLSTAQALADAAHFIREKNKEYGSGQKWIAIGGSYPGALSLWLREKYPDLVIGSIGSSGPINNAFDFYQYFQVVEKDIHKYDDANNQNCAETIRTALNQIRDGLQSVEGRDELSTLLNTQPALSTTSLDDTILATVFLPLAAPWKNSAQYGGLVGNPTIGDLCASVIDPTEPDIRKRLRALIADPIFYLDFDVTPMQTTDPASPLADTRGWYWLTCAELGYQQSTDGRSDIFGPLLPNNFLMRTCGDIFGLEMQEMREAVDGIRARYGGSDYYTGTNVLITNGELDPWSALGKYDAQHPSVVTYLIPGAVHCQDLGVDETNTHVQYAQQLAVHNIDKWLNEPVAPPGALNITDRVGERPPIAFASTPRRINEVRCHEADQNKVRAERPPLRGSRRNILTGRYNFGLAPPPGKASINVQWPPDLRQSFIEQPLDHFNNTDVRTFQQKFYANNIYANANGPNFLMIGGESPEGGDWVDLETFPFMQYAKEVGANMYVLEHRYYGESKAGTSDLQFLTSAQALFDIASFIEVAKTQSPSSGPWILFGGSYSGGLAAWAREWFPELVQGAVASSAPFNFKLDYYEYLQVVEEALVGSSQPCLDKTKEAFAHLWNLTLTPDGRQTLSTQFKFTTPWVADAHPAEDLQLVYRNILSTFAGAVQYSNDNNGLGTEVNVSALCSRMTADGDAFNNLVATHFWFLGDPNATISSDFAQAVTAIKDVVAHAGDTTYDDYTLAGILWMWQTCNEFGIFESTDYGYSAFRAVIPVNFYVLLCEAVFDINVDQVQQNIKRTLIQYGGTREYTYKGSNVVLPNGSQDPWKYLGLYNHPDPSVVSILIDGAAHVSDIYPESPTDSDSLKKARQTILTNIKQWINEAPAPGTTSTSVTSTSATTSGSSTHSTTTVNNGGGNTDSSVSTGSTSTPTPTTSTKAAPALAVTIAFTITCIVLL